MIFCNFRFIQINKSDLNFTESEYIHESMTVFCSNSIVLMIMKSRLLNIFTIRLWRNCQKYLKIKNTQINTLIREQRYETKINWITTDSLVISAICILENI